jgi:outer membrane immunogenic protein
VQRISIAVLGILGLMGTQAGAGDIEIKAPVPPSAPVSDWSGIYLGLEGGYGWGNQGTDSKFPGDSVPALFVETAPNPGVLTAPLSPPVFFPDLALSSTKQSGGLFGGLFGAQKQWGNLVLGIVGDVDTADIKGSGSSAGSGLTGLVVNFNFPPSTTPPFSFNCGFVGGCVTFNNNLSIDTKIDMLASLRGKVGWSITPDWLIYGTGGAAFAHAESTLTSSGSSALSPNLVTPVTLVIAGVPTTFAATGGTSLSTLSGGATMFGWALGAGVDRKLQFDSGSALVFGIEYLHYGFPEQTITLSSNAGGTFAYKVKENVDTIKGRISYLFSIH